MNSYIELATKNFHKSTHPQHQMVAVVVRGGSVLSVAANQHRWGHCAERRALRPHHDYIGATVIIIRNNGGCSKPCPRCAKLLKECGIKKVVYHDINRNLITERV